MRQSHQDKEAQLRADLMDFWRVDDSDGNHYGVFDRFTAAVLWDRVKRERLHLAWVAMTKLMPVGGCH